MFLKNKNYLITAFLLLNLQFLILQFSVPKTILAETTDLKSLDKNSNLKGDTSINADSFTLNSKSREFTYDGKVEVKKDDIHLTCKKLSGTYTESNKIENMIATKDVIINKGENLTAKAQKAKFFSNNNSVELTENPEVLQNGNLLTADKIVVFLDSELSQAFGNVAVTVANKDGLQDTTKK